MPSNFVFAARGCFKGISTLAGWLAGLLIGLTLYSWTAAAAGPEGPPALLDDMQGAAAVLRLLNPGPQTRLLEQSIDRGRFGAGTSAEHVAATAPPGESVEIGYGLPAAPVIEELALAAWVWCNQPGAQLAAMVVLPRSIDPETGAPWKLLVRSGVTAGPGAWQQLSLSNLPAGLASSARVARAQRRGSVDERGAYVTHLVILAPGGPGVTELWVDQVSVHGALRAAPQADPEVQPAAANVEPSAAPPNIPVEAATAEVGVPASPPRVPRVIQWQGEAFELVVRLGFDALAMGREPTDKELAEARRLGLFLVCPPPPHEVIDQRGLGVEYDPVLAWDLGQWADGGDAAMAEHWAQAIRRHDTRQSRAVVLRPTAAPLAASRVADLLLLSRPMLDSTLSWPDYAAWLTQQRRLARPGAGVWVAVQTHASSRRAAQLAAFRGERAAVVPATFHDLILATTAALGALPHGFYFQSQTSLAGSDAESHRRARSRWS